MGRMNVMVYKNGRVIETTRIRQNKKRQPSGCLFSLQNAYNTKTNNIGVIVVNKLKYALIGCGHVSGKHLTAAEHNKLNVIALVDVNKDRAVEQKQKFDVCANANVYIDYLEMLDKEKPDLVAVCVESDKHASVAIDCVNAGCHVIVEKPVALALCDIDTLAHQANVHHVKVCVNYQNRFNAPVLKTHEAVEHGRFGKLFYCNATMRWNRDDAYYAQASWRGTWAHDGGMLVNQCIHAVDILCWLMNDDVYEVTGVIDNMNHPNIEHEDFAVVLLKFKNGGYGVIEGTVNVYPRNLEETLCLFGEKGTVKIGGNRVNHLEAWRFADNIDNADTVIKQCNEDSTCDVYGFGHCVLYDNMIDAIYNDKHVPIGLDAGRKSLEVILAAYKSATTHQPVQLPLGNVSTTDFVDFFKR